MIVFSGRVPKSITLVRLGRVGEKISPAPPLASVIPLVLDFAPARGDTWHADVALQQRSDRTVEVTSHPISAGASMAHDHARRMPRTISATVLLTDTPFGGPSIQGAVPRALQLSSVLKQWCDERAVFAAITATEFFETAILTGLGEPRSPELGGAVELELSIQELFIFDVQIVATVDDLSARFGAVSPTSGGGVVLP